MLIKVIDAEYIRDYQIVLTFNDGTHEVVDLKNSLDGPVFEPLKKLENFKNFKLNRWRGCIKSH